MSTPTSTIIKLFQARLSRRISLCIFASIILIETAILVPSYYKRKSDLQKQIEKVSEAIVTSIVSLTRTNIMNSEYLFAQEVQELTQDSIILGVTVYRSDGKFMQSFGEKPDINPEDLRNSKQRKNQPTGQLTPDGKRYDIIWSSSKLQAPYILITRHDSSNIQKELNTYIRNIAGLVLLISAVVVVTTMLVLGYFIIVPILRLRTDLIAAGEALSNNDLNFSCRSFACKSTNELGELMTAFQQMFQRVATEINRRKQAEKILLIEQQKSEKLLLNILPQPIAKQLKEGQSNIADGFNEVTILFADLVGFTQLSTQMSPQELVKLLNDIFSAFDNLTDQYNLEKIKTIGDSYMVAGGLPLPCPNHAGAIAEMSLEMQETIKLLNKINSTNLSIRIGINTGVVVAGVIGRKKFIYDLWGDAVNTASRMESHGIPGEIQVSKDTYIRLKNQYEFKERGVIEVKGKGAMTTYLLRGRKAAQLTMAEKTHKTQ